MGCLHEHSCSAAGTSENIPFQIMLTPIVASAHPSSLLSSSSAEPSLASLSKASMCMSIIRNGSKFSSTTYRRTESDFQSPANTTCPRGSPLLIIAVARPARKLFGERAAHLSLPNIFSWHLSFRMKSEAFLFHNSVPAPCL